MAKLKPEACFARLFFPEYIIGKAYSEEPQYVSLVSEKWKKV